MLYRVICDMDIVYHSSNDRPLTNLPLQTDAPFRMLVKTNPFMNTLKIHGAYVIKL